VYVTQDIVTYPPGGPDADWGQRIQQQYQLVPEGLVFRLFGDRQFHEPAHPVLATRGLTDGTLHFPGDDVVKVKVLPVYAGMSFNRGRYLEASGRHAEAAAAFEEALAFDPQFAAARQALEQSRSALAGN
jgi:tetratricopeptide (TPR) repeat protein